MSDVKEAPKPTQTAQPAKRNGSGETQDIAPYWPRGYMTDLGREMNRFFEDFGIGNAFRMPGLFTAGDHPRPFAGLESVDWAPRIEISDRNGTFAIRAELPGLAKDDVQVEIMDGALVIQGERKQERREEKDGGYYSERRYGRFYRAIPLPEGAATDKADASFKDGVLEVKVPTPPREASACRRLSVR